MRTDKKTDRKMEVWMYEKEFDLFLVFSSQALMFSQSYRRNQNSKMSPESRIATKLKHLKLFLPLPPSISNLTHYIYIYLSVYIYVYIYLYIYILYR